MGRRRKIKSFRIEGKSLPPVKQYLSVDENERGRQYLALSELGIPLPPYEDIQREIMSREDLRVLREEWFIQFIYDGRRFRLTLLPGYIWDGASIPAFLVIGRLTKNGQAIEEPAMVHDVLFNQHLLSFEDSNNVFRALLNSKDGTSARRTKRRYTFGVRSPIGRRSYRKNNPETSWMRGYYKWEELS